MADFSEEIRELASQRAREGVDAPRFEPRPPPRPSGLPGNGGMRAGISALIRGERLATGLPVSPPREDPLRDVRGARRVSIDGVSTLVVQRRVEELVPEIDVGGELSAALARLSTRGTEDVHRGLRPAIGSELRELAVLDLETTGFWGCPIFLVGLLLWEDGGLVTKQLVAPDYPEEAVILRAAAHVLARRRLLVSFNGKSYDVPCLRERSVYHGVETRIGTMPHVDVLHPARRRFREELPDCRLQTLERFVVGIQRGGDVPSAEIPALYHRFAATGDVDCVLPVLHHSRVDLVTTALVLARLIESEG